MNLSVKILCQSFDLHLILMDLIYVQKKNYVTYDFHVYF